MTSLAEIATRPQPVNTGRLTNQNVADLMLEMDQRLRAAMRRGDHVEAIKIETELDLLFSALS